MAGAIGCQNGGACFKSAKQANKEMHMYHGTHGRVDRMLTKGSMTHQPVYPASKHTVL